MILVECLGSEAVGIEVDGGIGMCGGDGIEGGVVEDEDDVDEDVVGVLVLSVIGGVFVGKVFEEGGEDEVEECEVKEDMGGFIAGIGVEEEVEV